MPPKKLSGARRNRDENEADGFVNLREEDPLIITQEEPKPEHPFTVSRFFKEKLGDGLGHLLDADWSELKQRIANRSSVSKRWYMQVGSEEVGSEPAPGKFTGEVYKVQFCGIAEAESADTLSPYTFVIREHRAHADIEDCQPEKLKDLEEHGFRWLEIVADDEVSKINCYLLVTASEASELLKKPLSVGFGAVAGKDWSKKEEETTTTNNNNNNQDSAEGEKKQEEQTSSSSTNSKQIRTYTCGTSCINSNEAYSISPCRLCY